MLASEAESQPRARISAIITAYNGEAFVADAIESVLAQTRPVDELVVIDDGSTDNTAQVVERYRERGVRLVRQQNRGLSNARNRGVKETTGNLIAFLDCDDVWTPEKTALQSQLLAANPEAGLVTCHSWWCDVQSGRGGLYFQRLGRTHAVLRRKLAVRNYVGNASGVMTRRRVLDEIGGFDPSQVWAEDWELWLRIAERYRIMLVDRPLMTYRVVPDSLTQQRRWARSDAYYRFSLAAIRKVKPVFWRPILFLRSWSWREYSWAVCARLEGLPRWRYLAHAFLALISYPFEWTVEKSKDLIRALLGESFYKIYRVLRPLGVRAPGRVDVRSSNS